MLVLLALALATTEVPALGAAGPADAGSGREAQLRAGDGPATGVELAQAQSAPPRPPPVIRVEPPPDELAHPVSPAPPQGSGAQPVGPAPPQGGRTPFYYYPPGYLPYGAYDYTPPFWWGWDWGYGYYPIYPRPSSPFRDDQARRVISEVQMTAGPARESLATGGYTGFAGELALLVEGRRLGFHGSISGFSIGNGNVYGYVNGIDATTSLGLGTAHVTYAVVSRDFFRLRLEAGASLVSWPDTLYQTGILSFGPDVGVSTTLGLLGPLGLEAHVNLTPYPREVVDAEAALAFRFGTLAVTAGWRHLYVNGNPDYWGLHAGGTPYPSFRFDGPQFGLEVLF